MDEPPFTKLVRGQVYIIEFHPPDNPSETTTKYCVNLQEGSIVDNSPTFVGVNITTKRLKSIYATDMLLSSEESDTPGGAKVMCNQIHTYFKTQIKAAPYSLSQIRIEELNEKLSLGVGIIKIGDLRS